MANNVRFGIIGGGLMGREFGSAIARWCHLLDLPFRPVLTGLCDANPALFPWYQDNFPTLKVVTKDYRELLRSPDVDAVYCALPHNLHREAYVDIVRAGKHLLGEKPFGIDRPSALAIVEELKKHPKVFARCSSEFPFWPGAQRVIKAIRENRFGRIIEVNAGFLHSSDLNPEKPINWKRLVEVNGEYGCLGDLGMHALHLPLRAGWRPRRVFAHLSKIVDERPDGKGGRVPCRTWDNGTLSCEVENPADGRPFPLSVRIHRIAPGETDTWYIEVLGTRYSCRFSTRNPKAFQFMEYAGGAQTWQEENLGYETVYKTITGGIFEFGFSDAILQMWAAFMDELVHGKAPFPCATPDEALATHDVFTAALESQRTRQAVELRR
ncbi:MAG TPA: Gfo/Idh/MocA family oxidoreductase [Planctomycetota bacterium]|nr:Gfo/Idh/MocA family oxidoreductase [Planctomycetota bacterium]